MAAHIGPVSWKQDPFWAFVSILISNIWLGIPFMSVIILGGLQSISQEYYEAAEMDGASTIQRFRHITIPMIEPMHETARKGKTGPIGAARAAKKGLASK